MTDERRLLIDNDVFILTSPSDVRVPMLETLGFAAGATRRLEALPHMLRKQKKLQQSYPQETIGAALAACEMTPSLVEQPSRDCFDAFAAVDDINVGEALLFALTAQHSNWILTTGDKRALRALAGAPTLASFIDALQGRVVCLEALLLAMVRRIGAARLAIAFGPAASTHKTLKIVFSEVNRADDGLCCAALDSYLRDLRSDPQVARLLWNP